MSTVKLNRPKMSTKEKLVQNWRSGDIPSTIMLVPAIIFLVVCSIYPFIWVFRYVLCDYNGFQSTFTGLTNITRMFSDATFWNSVVHTFEYAFYKLIFIIPLSLLMAVLLNMRMRGSGIFRAIYFMPTVIASSISGMIFTFIFSTKNGILNGFARSIGLLNGPNINWLQNYTQPGYVMVAVTVLAIWGGFGNYMLYFINGINGISEDVYESAKIDGSTGARTFFSITLPMLSPVLKVILMLAITGAFKDYEAIMVLSQGGPNNRSMVMFLYIYNTIFGSVSSGSAIQIGYGALLSVMAALIVGVVTVIYMFVSRRLDDVM